MKESSGIYPVRYRLLDYCFGCILANFENKKESVPVFGTDSFRLPSSEYYKIPCANIALATFKNPATFAPFI